MPPKESNYHEQEIILKNLFSQFENFSFDKAKELSDRERDAYKGSGSPVWVFLLTSISQLSSIEKAYMNLAFLVPRGFLRKESSLRLTCETLLEDIEKKYPMQAVVSLPSSNTAAASKPAKKSENVIIHLCQQLAHFIKARLSMLTFYERLINLSSEKVESFDGAIQSINEIKKNNTGFHHPVLGPIKTLFNYECDILKHLLLSQKAMREWQFLPSLLHLHDAHLKLQEWQAVVQPKESKKYSFTASFLKPSPLPSLYQWFWRAKSVFVSKFSLYFYEPLSGQTTQADMKNLLSRQNVDYLAKIAAFVKKNEASCVYLVLKAANLEDYKGMGYHHPSQEQRPDTNICPYPVIFAYPSKSENCSTTVAKIAEKNGDFLSLDRVFHYSDVQNGSTFLLRVESHIILGTSFDIKKTDKDGTYVSDFMMDLATQLRCTKTFASLKPK